MNSFKKILPFMVMVVLFIGCVDKKSALDLQNNMSVAEIFTETKKSVKGDSSVDGDQTDVADMVYPFAGWNISGKGVSVGSDEVNIASNTITFGGAQIELGPLSYTSEGMLLDSSRQFQQIDLDLFGGNCTIAEYFFDEEGLTASMFVTFPEQLQTSSLLFHTVYFYQDGTFQVDGTIDQYGISLKEFDFSFERIWFNSEGIKISQAEIRLPAILDNATVSLSGLAIGNDGNVSIEGTNISPFEMLGMSFSFDDISISNRIVAFKGGMSLPETLPGVLSGRRLAIKNFQIGIDGDNLIIDISSNSEYTIPLFNNWSAVVSSPVIEFEDDSPWLVFEKCNLVFPGGFYVPDNNAFLEHLRFDPERGVFDFNTILLKNPIKVFYGEIEMLLADLSISNEGNFVFSGTGIFPENNVPPQVAGKTLPIRALEITGNGEMNKLLVRNSDASESNIIIKREEERSANKN